MNLLSQTNVSWYVRVCERWIYDQEFNDSFHNFIKYIYIIALEPRMAKWIHANVRSTIRLRKYLICVTKLFSEQVLIETCMNLYFAKHMCVAFLCVSSWSHFFRKIISGTLAKLSALLIDWKRDIECSIFLIIVQNLHYQ